MRVRDWMTKNVITLNEHDSAIKIMQLFKEHQIRRIPIVRDGKLVGIVTDRDIKSITSPKALSMDMYEFYYIISNLKVKDLMTPNPIVVHPDDDIEKATILMLENKISGLPVVDKYKNLVGIITQTDILKAFSSITCAFLKSYKVMLFIKSLEDFNRLLHILNEYISMPSFYNFISWKEEDCLGEDCKRPVIIKFYTEDENLVENLKEALFSNFEVFFFVEF